MAFFSNLLASFRSIISYFMKSLPRPLFALSPYDLRPDLPKREAPRFPPSDCIADDARVFSLLTVVYDGFTYFGGEGVASTVSTFFGSSGVG